MSVGHRSADGATAGYFEVLTHMAGQVPDQLLDAAYDWLAVEELVEVGRLLRFGGAAYGCTIPVAHVSEVRDLLAAAGAPANEAAGLVFPRAPNPPYQFSALPPGVDQRFRGGHGVVLDLVSSPDRRSASMVTDDVDVALAKACPTLPGLLAVWRSWRSPLGGASWPGLTRIVQAECDAAYDPVRLRAAIRAVIHRAGDMSASVDVLQTGQTLPGYHRQARAASALLWAFGDRPMPRLAPVFDGLVDDDPVFAPDHERIDDDLERARLSAFLRSGTYILLTQNHLKDILRPEQDLTVPIGVRTDGTWVWSDATTYYLEQHRLAPHPPLVDHARSVGYQAAPVDSIAEHQALAVVLRPGGPR